MNSDNPTPEFDSTSAKSNIQTEPESTQLPDLQLADSEPKLGKSLTTWIVSIIALVTVSDQLTKHWALESLSEIPGRSISVFGDFLRWTLVYNEGGAMGTNLGGSTLYGVIGVVILVALGYYLWQYRYVAKVALPLALIAGGAIGNLIDRFQLGKVVDWIDVDFFNIAIMGFRLERWWTFNIADSAISVALVYMLWQSLRPEQRGIHATKKLSAIDERTAKDEVTGQGSANDDSPEDQNG